MIKEYIHIAYEEDIKIMDFFDPSITVKSTRDVSEKIYEKLMANYSEASFEPLEYQGEKIGYFVWLPGLLISFGVNVHYRKKEPLEYVWKTILSKIGEDFSALLFSHNSRGIKWLQRCGMDVFAEEVTILIHSKK